ncbi:MAG TPA: CorA family divalent cation transporter [Bacteriovoracaceae bacterium]|nr:CorA family divalent cation transporter [Bacteriovoracaceae bacterium]
MITEFPLPGRDFKWFDVEEPHSLDLERLNSEFGLPYLLVQDCLRPEHLPKYEQTDEGHFLMMRMYDSEADLDATSVQDLTRKIALFITNSRVVSIHRVKLEQLNKLSERIQKSEHPKTFEALIHQIVLSIIRSYEKPIENLQDLYDDFESDVLSKKCETLDTTRIYRFRRQIFVIKRMLKQTNDSLYRFRDFWQESSSMNQDMRENIDQLYFRLDEVSDNFEHLFELHIALNAQRANEVMKVLTVFSSILLPLNFLASFYGMNFEHLPGLNSYNALYLLTFIMVLLSCSAIWYFRKKGWFSTPKE